MSKMTRHLSSLYLTTTRVATFLLWGWTEVTVLEKTLSIVVHRCEETFACDNHINETLRNMA
jgi:hypothetical protein